MNLDALRTFAIRRFVNAVAKGGDVAAQSTMLEADLDTLRTEAVKATVQRPAKLALEPITSTPYHNGRTLLDARSL